MVVCVAKRLSKKNTVYVCLLINDVIVSFDTMTILKVANLTPGALQSMSVGDVIYVK